MLFHRAATCAVLRPFPQRCARWASTTHRQVKPRTHLPGNGPCFWEKVPVMPPPQAAAQTAYNVAEISMDGLITQRSVTKSTLMTESKMHGRDFISLLPGDSVRRVRPDILVRESSIVVCFAHLRVVIGTDRVLVFDPDNQTVRSFIMTLAKSISDKMSNNTEYFEETVDFELRALENILSLVCDIYRRRAALISPLVDGVIKTFADHKHVSTHALQQLLPMKDHLSNFEIEVGMTRDVLTELLKNDEDLLGLLLSERMRRHGVQPPLEAHRSVELMLENYCSQMVLISQEAYLIRKRIESIQSVVELTLDSHRNRLLHFSLQLNVGTIALAWTTAIAGFFGMNLHTGIEDSPEAFMVVVTCSTVGAVGLFGWMINWIHQLSPNVDVKQGDFDVVFQHLDEIQTIFENGNVPGTNKVYFSRAEFRDAMRALNVSEEVADLVWNSFDVEGHGSIQKSSSSLHLRKLFDLGFLRRLHSTKQWLSDTTIK